MKKQSLKGKFQRLFSSLPFLHSYFLIFFLFSGFAVKGAKAVIPKLALKYVADSCTRSGVPEAVQAAAVAAEPGVYLC